MGCQGLADAIDQFGGAAVYDLAVYASVTLQSDELMAEVQACHHRDAISTKDFAGITDIVHSFVEYARRLGEFIYLVCRRADLKFFVENAHANGGDILVVFHSSVFVGFLDR